MKGTNMRSSKALLLAALALASGCSGCTTYRIVRYREPDARNQHVFPFRVVRHADTPQQFARARTMRDDLDTLTVRAADARRMPFAQYMTEHKVLAFLVIRNDTIVYEKYRDGMTDTTIHNSFSVTKSILSALVGIAVGEGKIRNLDDPVINYVSELRGRPAFDGVTVRHLLGMRSGLRFTETGNGFISDFRSDDADIYYTTDLLGSIKKTTRATPPGSIWDYKDNDAELLGIVLARAVGTSVAAYAEEKLWRRIGTEHDATWSLDRKNGQEKTSSGFNSTARDFARFGRLYLNGGVFNGQQVVPADWVGGSVAVDSSRHEPEISTWWQMQHTMYWWHAIQPVSGDFFADGSHGQRIYVDPKTRTIIVQLANDSRQDFPFRRITAYVNGTVWEYPRSIPALVRQAGMTYGRDSIRPVAARLLAEQRDAPDRYVITRSGMVTAGRLMAEDPKTRAAGVELLRFDSEMYPEFVDAFVQLAAACSKAGDAACAAQATARAAALRK